MRGAWWTGAIVGLAITSAPAAALELRMLTSWDRNNPAVPLLAETWPMVRNALMGP